MFVYNWDVFFVNVAWVVFSIKPPFVAFLSIQTSNIASLEEFFYLKIWTKKDDKNNVQQKYGEKTKRSPTQLGKRLFLCVLLCLYRCLGALGFHSMNQNLYVEIMSRLKYTINACYEPETGNVNGQIAKLPTLGLKYSSLLFQNRADHRQVLGLTDAENNKPRVGNFL